jgi:hypothetical protein
MSATVPTDLGAHVVADLVATLRRLKAQADAALAQVSDEEFFAALDPESNSLAVIAQHVAGNMRSRWTDFLTSDGEKPDRRRDSEFLIEGEDRRAVEEQWEAGWRALFDALAQLRPDDLMRDVIIRREPHTVVEAVNRQLTHYGEHVGQIIFLAKHLKSSEWKTLSIPRGQSEAVNKRIEAERQPQGYHERIRGEGK